MKKGKGKYKRKSVGREGGGNRTRGWDCGGGAQDKKEKGGIA